MFFDFYFIYVNKMFCYFKQDFINDGIQTSDTNSKMSGTNFFAPDILSGTPVKVIFRLGMIDLIPQKVSLGFHHIRL